MNRKTLKARAKVATSRGCVIDKVVHGKGHSKFYLTETATGATFMVTVSGSQDDTRAARLFKGDIGTALTKAKAA